MKLLCMFIIISFLAISHSIALAEVDFETEQAKLNTDDAGPVEVGGAEIEFAYGFLTGKHSFDTHAHRDSRGRIREHSYDIGVAFGVVDRVELNVGLGYTDLFDKDNDGPTHGHGWSDIEIGSKIQMYHSDEKELTCSYSPSFAIPSGRESRDDRLGPGDTFSAFNQRMILSKNWGRWNVNADSGYSLPIGNREGARGTWDTNVAGGYQLFSWLQPEIELHYAHDFASAADDSNSFAITGGVVMPVHERLRLNAGVQQVLAGSNTDQTTTVTIVATIFL